MLIITYLDIYILRVEEDETTPDSSHAPSLRLFTPSFHLDYYLNVRISKGARASDGMQLYMVLATSAPSSVVAHPRLPLLG